MRISSFSFRLLPLILLLAVVDAQDEYCTKGASHSCNTAHTPDNSPLEASLTTIIHDLEDNTYGKGSRVGSNIDYRNQISNTDDFPPAYGQGVCTSRVPSLWCNACLTTLGNCISTLCGNTVGAWAQDSNHFCFMRFEAYKFY